MKKQRELLLLLGMTLAGPGFPVDPTSFRWQAPVEGSFADQEVLSLKLPGDVLARTHHDLSDLRVLDEQGQETPYVIYEDEPPPPPARAFQFKPTRYQAKSGKEEIQLERASEPGAFDELEFSFEGRDFKREVSVQAAAEPGAWKDLAAGSLFDFSSRVELRKTTLAVPETSARFLRVILVSDTPEPSAAPGEKIPLRTPPRLASVVARLTHEQMRLARSDSRTLPGFKVTQDEHKQTLIEMGEVGLPLSRLVLGIGTPSFYRHLEALGNETGNAKDYTVLSATTIFRAPGMTESQTAINLSGRQQRFMRLRITNGDSPPLDVQSITAEWTPRYLYFIGAQGKQYSLYFSAPELREPNYDLASTLPRDRLPSLKVREISLGEAQPNVLYRPGGTPVFSAQESRERFLFTAVILLVAGCVGLWIFRLVRKLPQKS